MSTLPMPLLSLLRKFISDISVKRRSTKDSRTRNHGVLASLLRAAAIPSLGYLFGWNTRSKAAYISSEANLPTVGGDGKMPEGNKNPEKILSGDSKPPSRKGRDETPNSKNGQQYDPNSPIYQLMNNPALDDPLRRPRNPIVLSHGLYGFDVRGFSGIQIHYWSDVLEVLRKKVGVEVIVTRAPSTGSIQERAQKIHEFLKHEANGRQLNFLAHSMGGLDCRHLISNIKPTEYTPLSLMTVCTPHRGSPFMDWLKEHIGIGEASIPLPGVKPTSPVVPLPSSIVSFIDSPAYSNLTSKYLDVYFNPSTPDSPDVRYWSIAARTPGVSFLHPLWLPKLLVDAYEEKRQLLPNVSLEEKQLGNDGLVTVESAKWGEFLGVLEGCDHWDIRGGGGLSAHYAEEVKDNSKTGDKTWNWSEWQSFLRIWNKDKLRRDAATSQGSRDKQRKDKMDVVATLADPSAKKSILDAKSSERTPNDANSSTMDQVLDWVVDNVPGISAVKAPLKVVAGRTVMLGAAREAQDRNEEKMNPPRFDLEKFYIALSRKLYDEGL